MKKIYLILSIIFPILTACGPNPDEQVKKYALFFANEATNNHIQELKKFYPEIENADSIALNYNSENIKILPLDNESLNYRIRFTPETSIEIIRKKNGDIKIIESKGLFVFPDSLINLAKKWSLWNNKLNDLELSYIIKQQVIPKIEFNSPDLDFFNLHGPVKSMTISYVGFDGKKYPWLGVWGWKGEYYFDENGLWINPKEVLPNILKILRNDSNQINKIELPYNPLFGNNTIISYTWKGNFPESFVFYDYDGFNGGFIYHERVIAGIENFPHNPYETNYEITEKTILEDFKFDDIGNWVTCKCVYIYNEYINGNITEGSKSGTMTREINYY